MTFQPQTYAEFVEKARSKPQKPRKQLIRHTRLAHCGGTEKPPRTISRGLNANRGAGRKAKKAKRTKLMSRKSLIKKIDSLVFQIVCLMYAGCVECGSEDKPTTGHVLSRRSYATRWDFRNVFRQCWPCNYKAAMTAAASYHAWFVRTYGAEAFEQLYRAWTAGHKYSRLELIALVAEYQVKLESLKEQK